MNTTGLRIVRCAVVLAIASMVLGCGGATKYESPQAVYDAAKAAAEAKDTHKLFACLTPESQDLLVGVMAMGSVMAREMAVGFASMGGDAAKAEAEKKFAPLDEVLSKHGVSAADLEKQSENIDVKADPKSAMKQIAALVKDKPGFMADMMKAAESLDTDGKGGGPAEEFMANLSDVKIDGDKATGMISKPDTPNQKKPMHFKKVDGGWLIDMAAEFDEAGPMGGGPMGGPMGGGPMGGPMGDPLGDGPPAGDPFMENP